MDPAMELRLAAVLYKREKRIHNGELCKRANLNCGRYDLPRFLTGDTDSFSEAKKLETFLHSEGYTTTGRASERTYASLAHLMETATQERISRFLKAASGRYEAYQWSSTRTGMIIVSSLVIGYKPDSDAAFANIVEEQVNNVTGKGETYEGCGMFSNNSLVLVLTERDSNRAKFVICNEINRERMFGLMLKSSTTKPLHTSAIYLKRVSAEFEFNPRLDYLESMDEPVRKQLLKLITPFNLTMPGRVYKDVKSKTMSIMLENFVQTREN